MNKYKNYKSILSNSIILIVIFTFNLFKSLCSQGETEEKAVAFKMSLWK